MMERFELAYGRISEIATENITDMPVDCYFHDVAEYILMAVDTYEFASTESYVKSSLQSKSNWNKKLYAELTDDYENSYLNPVYAVSKLGEYGQVLSAVYAEMRSMTVYAFEQDLQSILNRMELFLEVYGLFAMAKADGDTLSAKAVLDSLSAFAYDYLGEDMEKAVANLYIPGEGIAYSIIKNADLSDISYLYDYGEYITDNDIRLATYLNSLPEEKIDKMAVSFTEGYRIGFVVNGKDLSIKETVEVRYPIGFERIVRRSLEIFNDLGLSVVLRRSACSFIAGRRFAKIGYFGSMACKQFECDHENDKALYFDKRFMERKLEAYHNALEKYKNEAGKFGGPAVIESFGEAPFAPKTAPAIVKPNAVVQKLLTEYNVRATNLVNQYVKGEERSFTIIAFPVPDIGDEFESIFDETIKLNTLDYIKYRDIQQKIIDTLDKAAYVKIEGKNGNDTDLCIKLWELRNPDKETIFENCVADVNIPVGEVFTSPVLEGTNGLLHVKDVYLNGLPYHNLKLELKDGMIAGYICDNYDNIKQNKEYIKEHLLFEHETLPIGEFAIGTNTTAYVMTKKYGLESVMPILIAEKTGPHFAMGDTCYSHEEDMITYNPDGKAIVARENSVSALRHEDPLKAYFGCHTDITIPYDELGSLYGVCEDGTKLAIIEDGRFVLEGTEELNKPLDEI